MKLQFDNNLDYQKQAIAAVVDLFKGQSVKQSNFTVTMADQRQMDLAGSIITEEIGVGNRLELIEDEILENLQQVQLRNGIEQTSALKKINMISI